MSGERSESFLRRSFIFVRKTAVCTGCHDKFKESCQKVLPNGNTSIKKW